MHHVQTLSKFQNNNRNNIKKPKKTKIENPFRDPNAPDIQMLRNAVDPDFVKKNAENFLQNPTNVINENVINDPIFKFCAQCGTKNKSSATFCSQCGSPLR